MEKKTGFCCLFLLGLTVVLSGSCVSDEKYRMKERESEKLSSQLTALTSEKSDLEKETRELRLKVFSLEGEMGRLKQDNTNLEEILKAKSGTLSKQIADLRKQNQILKQENETLQAKAKALEVEKTEEILGVKTMYEDLVHDMESEIKKGKITITQLEGKLKVNMVDEILFVVIPYIGDLLGVKLPYCNKENSEGNRAFIANSIKYFSCAKDNAKKTCETNKDLDWEGLCHV